MKAALAQLCTMKKQALDLTHKLKAQAKELNKGKASNKYQTTTGALEALLSKSKDLHDGLESKYVACDLESAEAELELIESQKEELSMLTAAANSALRIGKQKLTTGPAALPAKPPADGASV